MTRVSRVIKKMEILVIGGTKYFGIPMVKKYIRFATRCDN